MAELRRLRLAAGQSRRALALLCNVTSETILQWERHGVKNSDALLILADHFGVDPRILAPGYKPAVFVVDRESRKAS